MTRGSASAGIVLVVDDDEDTCGTLVDAMTRRGYQAHAARSGDAALEMIAKADFDVVLADVRLGGMTGLEVCRHIAERRPDVPVIVMTGHGNMDVAISAIRVGAYDFIEKPLSMDAVLLALARAVKHRQLAGEVRRLREAVESTRRLSSMVGDCPAIRRVYDLVDQVAQTDATVLITGESGTGKELVARAIHERSSRKDAPMVAINCAAMPAPLLESELFGHVRGAFTDAKRSRAGLFVQAGSGTVFLDEIGEMPLEMQVKLLRVLQERKVRPVGGDEETAFEARLVTATNRDLDTEVEEGRFRQDLFYRINVVHIPVPPLRSRQGDVVLLAAHF
jgi:two-component system response regulator HydG